MFSLVPRCHGLCGLQKYTCRPVSMRSWACCASSAPWSQVRDLRSCSGRVVMVGGNRVTNRLGAVPGERRTILDPGPCMLWHARQVQQHGEPGGPFDERADGRTVETEDEVTLPVAGYGPVVGLGWPLADEHLVADEALDACTGARPRDAECASRAQASGELTPQGTPALNE